VSTTRTLHDAAGLDSGRHGDQLASGRAPGADCGRY
jgi:hypothetical protein